MNDAERRRRMHDLDSTVRVGKGGVENVAEEVSAQLDDRDLVKVKFLRAARGAGTTDELAAELAEAADAELIETRGHTATFQ